MIRTLWMAAAIAMPALAQSNATSPIAFEVVSVKPNTSEDMRPRVTTSGARFSATNLPLVMLVADAYGFPLQSTRVSGLPQWTWRERFDIEAKASGEILPPDLAASERRARGRALLQSLLADRFKLAVHRETKEMQFYALTIGKNGPKLTKAAIEEKDCADEPAPGGVRCHQFNGGQGRGLHGKAVTMQDLVEFIENWTDHPVLDKTSLTGLFAIESEGWTPMRQAAPPPDGTSAAPAVPRAPSGDGDMFDTARPTLFTVLQKLGLELKLEKGPIEIFVVDHVERPAAN